MTFGSIIYTLLFQPLQIIFEIIYKLAYSIVGNNGISIVALSLAMNFIVLPLYRRADAMQQEERVIQAKLHDGVEHIKKTFKGDERMMMLQAYYRQNNYKPTYVLRGATSLFLQIPFFIAAYRFLSSLSSLDGSSFGIISDLSKPDGLLVINNVAINLLPFIMTLLNCVSSALYSKGFPAKTKVQLYVTAAFFLVFLYNMPSGLVFYWTLNNAFSLLKTLVIKSDSKLFVNVLPVVIGLGLTIFGGYSVITAYDDNSFLIFIIGLILVIKFAADFDKRHSRKSKKKPTRLSRLIDDTKYNNKIFAFGCVLLAILTGAVIPSAVISASPQEFIFTSYYQSPLWYILSATLLSFGTFVIWFGIFYWLSSPKAKSFFTKFVWIACCGAIVDYMFFGKNSGTLTSELEVKSATGSFNTPVSEALINYVVLAVVIIAALLIYKKLNKAIVSVIVVCVIAFSSMTVINIAKINSSLSNVVIDDSVDSQLKVKLSKTGKNVVVIMLDRGFGPYIPYILNEKPELIEKYDGFTYYANTLSYGGHTNFASAAFWGGYEYTPIEMNSRTDELLEDKQNEALKMMPKLFSQNGYDVSVCNPNYAGYQWIPDLSIYNDLENVSAYNSGDTFVDSDKKEKIVQANKRNFFMYGILKISPSFLQKTIYCRGYYFGSNNSQIITSRYTSTGIYNRFYNAYSVLKNLPEITTYSDNEKGNVLLMTNDTTHEQQLLQTPDYTPEDKVDNTEYYQQIADNFTINGVTLKLDDVFQMTIYQINMSAIIQLGNWFDYLREIGVYDNTKIIIASDHGYNINQIDGYTVDNEDLEYFMPLLMVKDFNSTGFETSDEFMTNADIPSIALDNVVEDKANPYTGKQINSDEKLAHDQYVIYSEDWITDKNNGNQFLPADWYSVHDSIWDINNWKKVATNQVLTHKDVK